MESEEMPNENGSGSLALQAQEENSASGSEPLQPRPQASLVRGLRRLNLNSETELPAQAPATRRKRISQRIESLGSPGHSGNLWPLQSMLLDALSSRKGPKFNRGKQKGTPEDQKTNQPFRCTCSFCVPNNWDPSENARIDMD
ncbi:developmental pluripotency-associated protein 3 [Thomomys bottae]